MTTMQVDLNLLGRWTMPKQFVVEASRTRAFAAAINDDNPLHTGGTVAPPIFACVPIVDHIDEAVSGLVSDEAKQWSVHGAQDSELYVPLRDGMVLTSRVAPVGIFPRFGGVTALVLKIESRLEDGALANMGYVSLVFRRKYEGGGHGEPAPDHRSPSEAKTAARAAGTLHSVTYMIDPDQTYRYAEASGDHNPIHIDPAFAQSVGLPGIIVHGMCTMGFASRAVIAHACADVSTRLRRMAVRFARPVVPGKPITTHLWPVGAAADRAPNGRAGESDGRQRWAFETVNQDGKAVLLDGLAEVDNSTTI
jgi:acyl dehydratase